MSFFEDKVAIVTGAASGIGRALYEELAARGARVVVTDINDEALESAFSQMKPSKHPVQTARLDVTDHAAFR